MTSFLRFNQGYTCGTTIIILEIFSNAIQSEIVQYFLKLYSHKIFIFIATIHNIFFFFFKFWIIFN